MSKRARRNAPAPRGKLPRAVLVLGFVSLLMDVASELVHSLLPALFVSLGLSMASVGLIEGIAEATAALTKVLSGALSDRLTSVPCKDQIWQDSWRL